MFMKKSVLCVFLVAVIISCWSTGCTDKKQASTDTIVADTLPADTSKVDTLDNLISETPMPKAADELFDDFIFNFAANRKLQMKRIKFPLPVDRFGKLSYVKKKQWKMEHFFMEILVWK